jgi:hypothetical protein
MTIFERAVLQILAGATEALGWYQIERRLSTIVIAERSPLPEVLRNLQGQRMIEEVHFAEKPLIRYRITSAGKELLAVSEN